MAQKGTEVERVQEQVTEVATMDGAEVISRKSDAVVDRGFGTGSDRGACSSSVSGGKNVGQVEGTPAVAASSDSVSADISEDTLVTESELPDADDLDDTLDGGELSGMEDTGVVVRREKFLSKERRVRYWGYFVTGALRGRAVRVSLVSTDAGGYDLLDIVFNGAEMVALWRKPYELRDEKGEKTASGFTFYAVSLDEDGTVYTSQVKPSRKSDKALLEKLVELSMRSFKREVE